MTSKFNIQAFTGRLMAMATEWRLDGVTHTHTHSNTHSRSVGIKDGSRSVFMSVFVCSPGSEAEEEGGRREPVRSLRFSSREKWNHFYKRKTSEVEKLNTETFTEKKNQQPTGRHLKDEDWRGRQTRHLPHKATNSFALKQVSLFPQVSVNLLCESQPAGGVKVHEAKRKVGGRPRHPTANAASMHDTVNANQTPASVAFHDAWMLLSPLSP